MNSRTEKLGCMLPSIHIGRVLKVNRNFRAGGWVFWPWVTTNSRPPFQTCAAYDSCPSNSSQRI